MRLKNYRADLPKRLADPHYAPEYLAQVLAEKDSSVFLIALKDVVEAGGGVGNLAGRARNMAFLPAQFCGLRRDTMGNARINRAGGQNDFHRELAHDGISTGRALGRRAKIGKVSSALEMTHPSANALRTFY